MKPSVLRRRALGATAVGAAGLLAAGLAAFAPAAPAAVAHRFAPVVHPASAGHVDTGDVWADAPPTTATCEATKKIACYSPLQYQTAYGLQSLYDGGLTGAGHTIALIDCFGSPTIKNDLHTFDQAYGLPDPNLSIVQPSGAVPPYDPTKNDGEQVDWAFETTLDVEYAHAMAPGANILLVETPVAETEGSTGLPELMDAELYVVQHHLADVMSQSFGATEQTFASPKDILRLRYAFTAAQKKGVTVLASSGDNGATSQTLSGDADYPYRVNSWPSSDPLVTSVGGTMLSLDANGNRTAPDATWNDGYGAGGGGVSSVFARPSYQDSVQKVVGAQRGTPDISMSAAVNGGAIIYTSFAGLSTGYHIVGGTSEASPLLAGVVALADQEAGHRLGLIDPTLYAMRYGRKGGLVDVTSGNNTFAGVTGYPAKRGYDLATGLGTINGPSFVAALARG